MMRYRPTFSSPSAWVHALSVVSAGLGRGARLPLLMAAAVAAAGCASLAPRPLDDAAVSDRVRVDRTRMSAGQEAVTPVLTLEEATARAIKYNLDHRQRMLETALQQGILDTSRFDLLPRLTASAGYLMRSNDLFAQQQTLGQPYNPQAPFTTASERHHRIAAAELSWNLLDFGVSYYRARAQSDQVLIAEERKRKAVQNIVQDVRSVYWRALGAQRLAPRVDDLIRRADAALANAREIEQKGLLPVPQALAYQRALLDSITLLQSRRTDMELARSELASLMNAPGSPFQLSDLAEDPLPVPPPAVTELENLAMASRPELREEDYRKRISASEARRALAATLPGISVDLGYRHDSNRYLYHNAWAEGGLRISLDLLRLAAIPTIQRQSEAQAQLDDARRLAQSLAVLTQVRVAALRYGLARSEYQTYSQSADVDERLANYSRASATSRVESELEVVRTEARALLSEYQRHIAYANAQAAIGRLYNSIGLDVQATDGSIPVRALALQIRQSLRTWEQFTFQAPRLGARGVAADVALKIDGVERPDEQKAIGAAFDEVYRRHDLRLVAGAADGDLVWTLVATRSSPTTWWMTLLRPNGKVAVRTSYRGLAGRGDEPVRAAADVRGAAETSANLVREMLRGDEVAVLDRP